MIIIERMIFLPDVTLGQLWDTDSSFRCWTVENPWEYNKLWVSCIPEGFYRIRYVEGLRKRGAQWKISKVPGRSDIEFHVANTADDVQGCIGLGDKLNVFRGNALGVSNSAVTIAAFNEQLKMQREGGETLFITKGKMS